MKRFRSTLSITLFMLLLFGCKKEYTDYSYKVTNSSSQDSVFVSCQITSKNPFAKSDSTIVLKKDETYTLCKRLDVVGNGIWDIENSIKLYKIKSLSVRSSDQNMSSIDLSFRKFWTGPGSDGVDGIYELNITDDIFSIKKQVAYLYKIRNELNEKLHYTCYFNKLKDTDPTHQTDSLLPNKTAVIGSIDIYSYIYPQKDIDLYKEYKLSGIQSLQFTYNNKRTNINTKRDTSIFKIYEDSCVIVITPEFIK